MAPIRKCSSWVMNSLGSCCLVDYDGMHYVMGLSFSDFYFSVFKKQI